MEGTLRSPSLCWMKRSPTPTCFSESIVASDTLDDPPDAVVLAREHPRPTSPSRHPSVLSPTRNAPLTTVPRAACERSEPPFRSMSRSRRRRGTADRAVPGAAPAERGVTCTTGTGTLSLEQDQAAMRVTGAKSSREPTPSLASRPRLRGGDRSSPCGARSTKGRGGRDARCTAVPSARRRRSGPRCRPVARTAGGSGGSRWLPLAGHPSLCPSGAFWAIQPHVGSSAS